jgi:hypothetical protein
MKTVTVRVPEKLTLEQSQKVLVSVLGKLGCGACYSGFNISFENAVDPANVVLSVEKSSLSVSEIGA